MGCDANSDTLVDAGDVACITRKIFGRGCDRSRASLGGDLGLTMPEESAVSEARTVSIPIHLHTGSQAVQSVAFSLDFDSTLVDFSNADTNGDGTPDAVVFAGVAVSHRSVRYDPADTDGELDFLITDVASSPRLLADGLLVTVEFAVRGSVSESPISRALRFAVEPRASFGDAEGRSLPGSTGFAEPPLLTDGFESGDTSA